MNEGISVQDVRRYAWELFDGDEEALKAAEIMAGMWAARSVRVSEVARRMPGGKVANARGIFRFLSWAEPGIALNRLHHDEAPYGLMDVTDIQRPQAKKTEHVGRLKDGKTRRFDLLIPATPYRGEGYRFTVRVIPPGPSASSVPRGIWNIGGPCGRCCPCCETGRWWGTESSATRATSRIWSRRGFST